MLHILGWILWSGIIASILWFIATCAREGDAVALGKGVSILLPVSGLMLLIMLYEFPGKNWMLSCAILIFVLLSIFMIIPVKSRMSTRIAGEQNRIDERDALFHRFYRIKPGSREFDAYYQEHPENLEVDEKIRALPDHGMPGSRTYNELSTPYHAAIFSVLEGLTKKVAWIPDTSTAPVENISSQLLTERIKGFARYLGADIVGTTRLNPAYIYSHVGRGQGEWGKKINIDHEYAIAIAVEMSHDMVRHAPDLPTMTETSLKYFETAKIATILARYISSLGYEAQAHVDGNYRVMAVPIAADAGLGELGRLGLLITPEYGPRIRLSVVSTNMPLTQDVALNFGVQHFCTICKKCAEFCPTNSVDSGNKKIIAGVEKWKSHQENCYRFWRIQGTDCALCVNVCPYSYPNTSMHNLVRWFVRRNSFARRIIYWGDRIIYHHIARRRHQLPLWHDSV